MDYWIPFVVALALFALCCCVAICLLSVGHKAARLMGRLFQDQEPDLNFVHRPYLTCVRCGGVDYYRLEQGWCCINCGEVETLDVD